MGLGGSEVEEIAFFQKRVSQVGEQVFLTLPLLPPKLTLYEMFTDYAVCTALIGKLNQSSMTDFKSKTLGLRPS